MLSNKVSPATLYIPSDPSVQAENASGTEDYQLCNSQVSLFNSDPPSSMELFSDIHNQSQSQGVDTFPQRVTSQQRTKWSAPKTDYRQLKLQPEISLSRKFYLKYLNNGKQEMQKTQKSLSRSEDSQMSGKSSQDGSYEAWKAKQVKKSESLEFMTEIQKAIREGLKEVKGELHREIKELRVVMAEHKSSIENSQQLSAQILTSLTDLKQCVEHSRQERVTLDAAATAKLESQVFNLSVKIDKLCEDFYKRVQGLKGLIDSTLTRNAASNQTETSMQNDSGSSTKAPAPKGHFLLQDNQAVPSTCGTVAHHATEYHLSPQQAQALSMNCEGNEKPQAVKRIELSDLSGRSTACDIHVDLTKQSPSACSQTIAQLLTKDESAQIKPDYVEEKKGPKRRKVQRTQRPTQANKRRSQRLQGATSLQHCQNERSDTEQQSFQPKRRSSQTLHQRQQQRTKTTPTKALESCFFSQTPVMSSCVKMVSANIAEQLLIKTEGQAELSATEEHKSSERFYRSAEAAKRRVKVFAGLNSTSALLELSNSIKKQQGYISDDSL